MMQNKRPDPTASQLNALKNQDLKIIDKQWDIQTF